MGGFDYPLLFNSGAEPPHNMEDIVDITGYRWIYSTKDKETGEKQAYLVLKSRVLGIIRAVEEGGVSLYYIRLGAAVGPPAAHGVGRVAFGSYVNLDTAKRVLVKYFQDCIIGVSETEDDD